MVIAKLKLNNVVQPFFFEHVDTAVDDIYKVLVEHGVELVRAQDILRWCIKAWAEVSNGAYSLLGTIGYWNTFEISVFDDFGLSDDLPFE